MIVELSETLAFEISDAFYRNVSSKLLNAKSN